MKIIISTGSALERRKEDGTLEPLTVDEIANSAYMTDGVVFAPCQTWEKDYPGQVTAGRIGRPVIRYCPLSWHPQAVGDEVRRMLADRAT